MLARAQRQRALTLLPLHPTWHASGVHKQSRLHGKCLHVAHGRTRPRSSETLAAWPSRSTIRRSWSHSKLSHAYACRTSITRRAAVQQPVVSTPHKLTAENDTLGNRIRTAKFL